MKRYDVDGVTPLGKGMDLSFLGQPYETDPVSRVQHDIDLARA